MDIVSTKILVAHPGTQYSYQLARQLYKKNVLFRFYTGIAFGKDTWIYKICSNLPDIIYRKISNRFIDEVPDHLIKRNFFSELRALLWLKMGANEEKVLFNRNRRFQTNISSSSILEATSIIGFDTSSWLLAERCRNLSKPFFLDVSIGHPLSKEKVYNEIGELYPDWAFALKKKKVAQVKLEQKEMELASHIVVASTFTFKTYTSNGIDPGKISVNPYGVDSEIFKPVNKIKTKTDILDFVFVGLVDARKGIPLLLNAWKLLTNKNIRLTLIGPVSDDIKDFIRTYFLNVIVKGKLSFEQLTYALPYYDILIFPSFFEGYGLVIPEAMACGLPVITSSATCGPDLIENGKQGFVIDPGNEEMLISAIEYFISDPTVFLEMGIAARKKAGGISWETYGNKWQSVLNSNFEPRSNEKVYS